MESLEDRLLAMVQEPPQHMHDRVPQEEDEMLHFALSLVPLLNKLSGWGKLRAKIALLEGLQGVHDLDQGHQQAQMQGPGLIRPWDPSHPTRATSHPTRAANPNYYMHHPHMHRQRGTDQVRRLGGNVVRVLCPHPFLTSQTYSVLIVQ